MTKAKNIRRNFREGLVLILFFISLNTAAFSQFSIQGKIVDNYTNPLIGANVYLPELNKGSSSDENGLFELKDLPKGLIKLQVSYIGYQGIFREMLIDSSVQDLVLMLKPVVIESQEVVISGGHISTQHENAVKIDILSKEAFDINSKGNIMHALAEIPGIDMISKGQGVAKPVIRGLSMNDILVLNNNVRIENYQYGENHPLGIDANQIERIEIIKGPASLLYGSDAIGGVLNFVKESPPPMGELKGDININLHSNTKGINGSFGLKGASKKIFGGICANLKSHADYLQADMAFAPNTRFNELTLSAYTGYTGKDGVFKLSYDRFSQNLGMLLPPSVNLVNEPGRKNEFWYQELSHQVLSFQNKIYINSIKLEVNAALQEAWRKLITTIAEPEVEMKLKTLTYESKLHFPSYGTSAYFLGFQGMNQHNNNLNERNTKILPDAAINNIGVFGLAQYKAFDILNLQAGARFDYYNLNSEEIGASGEPNYHKAVQKDFSNFSASAGLTIEASDKLYLRLNIANAFRAPNVSELTSSGIHGNRFEQGNPNLNPQQATETDFSLHFHGSYLSIDFALFYNQIKDYIYLSPSGELTPEGLNIYTFTQSNASLYGGEESIHFHPRSLPYLHIVSKFSHVVGKQENGDYLPFIPAAKWRNEIRIETDKIGFLLNPGIKISSLSAMQQEHPAPSESVTNAYTILNLQLNSAIKIFRTKVKIAFAVENLTDKAYFDHLSTLKELNYLNQGRNFTFSVLIPFDIIN